MMKTVTDYGPIQAPNHLGIPVWQFEAALRHNLIPHADCGGRWSASVIDDAAKRLPEILAAIGDQAPIGANRAAERIGERLNLELARADIEELDARGLLTQVGDYKGWALYDVLHLDRLVDTDPELITTLVAERLAWLENSVHPRDAQAELGFSRTEFDRVARERGIEPGRFGRFLRTDIEALASDEDLADDVRGQRQLGPDQAAQHLEIRRVDFDYCVAAGWIKPAGYTQSQISRRRSIDVPLFRTADVDALRDLPGVHWEAVRAVRPGEPSPLREFAALPIPRSTLVRGFAADISERYGIEVTPTYDADRDRWQLAWSANSAGEPTREAIAASIAADRHLAPHRRAIALRPTENHSEPPPAS